MLKLSKLNNKGFSHHFLMAFIVLAVAIGGTYYLVASHAQTALPGNGLLYANGRVTMNNDGSYRMGSVESAPNQTGSNNLASWSPDGNQVVASYYNSTNNTASVISSNADGTNSKVIYTKSGTTNISKPIWSADGQWIAFMSDNNSLIYIIHPDGTGIKELSSPVNIENSYTIGYGWLTDSSGLIALQSYGQVLLAGGQNQKLCRIPVSGSATCNDTSIFRASGLAVSPDSTKILFAAVSLAAQNISNLFTANIDGTNITQITQMPTTDSTLGFNWSPDATKIVYGIISNGTTRTSSLNIMNADGTGSTKIIDGYSNADWQPVTSTTVLSKYSPAISCTINNVPTSKVYGSSFTPSVTITNTGNMALKPSAPLQANPTANPLYPTTALADLPAGQSVTANYSAVYPYTNAAVTETLTVNGSGSNLRLVGKIPMSCSKSFTIVKLTYLSTCTLTGVPATLKRGTGFTPVLAVKNTGTGKLLSETMGVSIKTSAGTVMKTYANVIYPALNPGVTSSKTYAKYTVPATTTATKATVYAKGAGATGGIAIAINCSKTFTITK